MKSILIISLLFGSFVFASSKHEEKLLDKHTEQQLKREKKWANEQKFYQADEYDFKGAEVDPDSVKKLKRIKTDDLDMDDVYD